MCAPTLSPPRNLSRVAAAEQLPEWDAAQHLIFAFPYLTFRSLAVFTFSFFFAIFPFVFFFRGFLLLFFFSGTSFFAQNLNYYLQWLSTCCFFVPLFFFLLLLKFLCNFSLSSTFARTAPTKLANFIWYFQFSFLLSFRLFFVFVFPALSKFERAEKLKTAS